MKRFVPFGVVGVMALVAAAVAVSDPTAATSGAARNEAVTLRGVDSVNVRPFTLGRDSDIVWSCPGCGGSNFALSTNQDIPINALGPTHGRSFLERGRYTGVSVMASGSWRITMTPARQVPVRRSYRFTGVDSVNLRPFTLTHGSDIFWSCPRCRGSNFAISTDQDIPVNALGPIHGRSYLERGRYTGVNVMASGPWTIIFR
jgi:hypothetical protein